MQRRHWLTLLGLGTAHAVHADPMDHGAMGDMGDMGDMGEMHASPAHGAMDARDASGTAWQPDSSPMFMWHVRAGDWSLALHTNSFVGYDSASSRGDSELVSINWLMGMASHPTAGGGDLTVRAMVSAEPATMPGNGYPLLLQTGESYNGEPLIDRQHPHDLFMELALRYRQPLAGGVGLELYLAPVGEPAIGPAAFPHRFTAMADPLAPLGHHWFDSTHITFGVATAGLYTHTFKLEGSYFNGREPDETRTNFDFRVPDSYSARLSVNPSRDVSAQVSWAHLESPEFLEQDVRVQRTTASVAWNHDLGLGSNVGVTAAVGQNNPSMGPATYASLAEGAVLWHDTHNLFARLEALTKSGHDLALPVAMRDDRFAIGALSAGYIYDLHELPSVATGIGVAATIDVVGSTLGDVYGTRVPVGGMVFLRVRPSLIRHSGMH